MIALAVIGLVSIVGLFIATWAAGPDVVTKRGEPEPEETEPTGVQCQGCLADVRECCCPLAGER